MEIPNIANIIEKGLLRKKMTQRELAHQMGKSDATVSGWISGEKKPVAEDLIRLAIFLDVVPEIFPGYRKFEENPQWEISSIVNNMQARLIEIEKRIGVK